MHWCTFRWEGGAVQELEGENENLRAELDSERERWAQQAISLRRDIAAVQSSAEDDKERTCDLVARSISVPETVVVVVVVVVVALLVTVYCVGLLITPTNIVRVIRK
jgi:hypothetical protein